ncbi:hypothetical protein NIES4106_53550 [Fischerella sp. NIES-4106]|nr:hypothetical protein NIES4106_10260 [Fischerella sp. NIES-4106]BAZ70560.1 hypothetical protein NIES4106_53550 [Fischerella sp. NIES-4106]
MNQLTLQQIFGVNVSQDSQTLTIRKSDLSLLTPSSANTAESLLAAILINVLINFQGTITLENNQPIIDEDEQPITYDNSEAFELLKVISWNAFLAIRNNQQHINHQIIVSNYAPD